MGPINYATQVVNPLDSFMRGIGQVQQIENADRVIDQRDRSLDLQAFAMGQKEKRAGELQAMSGELAATLSNPNATSEDFAALLAKYPQLQDEIMKPWEALSETRKEAGLRFTGQVYSMLETGNMAMALEVIDERIAAAERSNNAQALREARMMRHLIQTDPEKAKGLARMLGVTLGGDKWDEMTGGGSSAIRSSKILPSGTVVAVTDSGPVVYDAGGNVLTGPDAAAAVREAEDRGVELARNTNYGRAVGTNQGEIDTGAAAAGSKASGVQGIELANEAFSAASNARRTVSNIDEAIDALDRGANSGVIESRFPSWNAATIELENAANRLGLDVIGSVTFGALSEGELRLAMQTALPLNLSPPQLKDWLQRKRGAQMKLIDYMEEQARFLSKPGNTLAKWLDKVNGEAPAGNREAATPRAPRSYMKYATD